MPPRRRSSLVAVHADQGQVEGNVPLSGVLIILLVLAAISALWVNEFLVEADIEDGKLPYRISLKARKSGSRKLHQFLEVEAGTIQDCECDKVVTDALHYYTEKRSSSADPIKRDVVRRDNKKVITQDSEEDTASYGTDRDSDQDAAEASEDSTEMIPEEDSSGQSASSSVEGSEENAFTEDDEEESAEHGSSMSNEGNAKQSGEEESLSSEGTLSRDDGAESFDEARSFELISDDELDSEDDSETLEVSAEILGNNAETADSTGDSEEQIDEAEDSDETDATTEDSEESVDDATEDSEESVDDATEDSEESVDDATEDSGESVDDATDDSEESVNDATEDSEESVDDATEDSEETVGSTKDSEESVDATEDSEESADEATGEFVDTASVEVVESMEESEEANRSDEVLDTTQESEDDSDVSGSPEESEEIEVEDTLENTEESEVSVEDADSLEDSEESGSLDGVDASDSLEDVDGSRSGDEPSSDEGIQTDDEEESSDETTDSDDTSAETSADDSGGEEGSDEVLSAESSVAITSEEPEDEIELSSQSNSRADSERSAVKPVKKARKLVSNRMNSDESSVPGRIDGTRDRHHVSEILGFSEIGSQRDSKEEKLIQQILKELKKLSQDSIKPLEKSFKFNDISQRVLGDAEIFNKPMALFLGPWSSGKSTAINYILGTSKSRAAIKTGPQPTDSFFTIVHHSDEDTIRESGVQMAGDWAFSGVNRFGQAFLSHFRGIGVNHPLLKKVTIVDTPGIIDGRRFDDFPLQDVFQWFIDRADAIYVVFDPSKLEIGNDMKALLDQLKGKEQQTKFLLNKADMLEANEILKVAGQLLWNVSPLFGSSDAPSIFSVSLIPRPYLPGSPSDYLLDQEQEFLSHLREIMDERVENTVMFARRHAVRVRNHAKLVDCYLDAFYKQKGIFGNKKRVAEQIIRDPAMFNIFDTVSQSKNISKYDLLEPEDYRTFYKLNPLQDFTRLKDLCGYVKGCPIDKLDRLIAFGLPQLFQKYQEKSTISHGSLERTQTSAPEKKVPTPKTRKSKK